MAEWEHHSGLHTVLGEAQRIGALGRAPIPEVIRHALKFVEALPLGCRSCVDLGSGAGVPGLVIAVARPEITVTLVDRRAKRTDALERAVRALGISERTSVVCADVDDLTRDARWRHQFDAAVSRGFGPPAATLRVASQLVRSAGTVVISEPPADTPARWSQELLQAANVVSWERLEAVAVFHVEHSIPNETH